MWTEECGNKRQGQGEREAEAMAVGDRDIESVLRLWTEAIEEARAR